jgi:prepilin-type N-terminal cleavage/methylation domain-containing protein
MGGIAMQRGLGVKGFTLIELMIVVAIIGTLAALAIPNLIKFSCKAKQSEVRQNLGSMFATMNTYFSDNDTYPDTALIGTSTLDCWQLIYWESTSTRRYTYQCGTTPALIMAETKRSLQDCPRPLSTTGSTGTGFTLAATGNVDSDNTCCDEWAMNDQKLIRNQKAEPNRWGESMNDCALDSCP